MAAKQTTVERATAEVDAAWQRMKAQPSPETETAYDDAHSRWKGLRGNRSVGRPRSGDQSLTSSARANAARAKQHAAATRWETAAPLIQKLRAAFDTNDSAAIIEAAKELARGTATTLRGFKVVHAQPDSDFVVLHAWHGQQMVLTFIPTMHLEDYFRCRRLSGKQANLLVDLNLDAFARIISGKYERGGYRTYSRYGSTLPRIDISLEDIETSSEILSDSVLHRASGWLPPHGPHFS